MRKIVSIFMLLATTIPTLLHAEIADDEALKAFEKGKGYSIEDANLAYKSGNVVKAKKIFEMYCATDDVGFLKHSQFACLMLGSIANEEKNFNEAFNWYKKSADKGQVSAQYDLALMYYNGTGTAKDVKQSINYLTLAATQGYAKAQARLGLLYDEGSDVLQDYNEAFKWYKLAAEQGNEIAQGLLAGLYYMGQGVEKSKIYAYMWYNLSVANGYKAALEMRKRVALDLTENELREAQRLSKQCVQRSYKNC